MVAWWLLATLQTPTPPSDPFPRIPDAPGRYEMGWRLRQLDAAWIESGSAERRMAATTPITAAVTQFFGGQTSAASAALDRAVDELRGRPVNTSGVTVRGWPPIVQPDGTVRLLVRRDYNQDATLSVRIQRTTIRLAPRAQKLIRLPARDLPLRGSNRRVRWWVDGREGPPVAVADLPNFNVRMQALEASQDRKVVAIRRAISRSLAPDTELVMDIGSLLAEAEQLASGQKTLRDLTEIRAAETANGTPLRASIPPRLSSPLTVVVALHGAGGSENLFYEGYGSGRAVSEARRRGWVFLSPRSAPGAVKGSLDWLSDEVGIRPARVVVMGHSMGGGLALRSTDPRPDALVLFAPAAAAVPVRLRQVPIYLAVGEQELGMLRSGIRSLGTGLQAPSVYRTYPRCEHLMIVADAAPDAFRWLDQTLRRSETD